MFTTKVKYTLRRTAILGIFAAVATALGSCFGSDDGTTADDVQATAVVTVIPSKTGAPTLILDDETALVPTNLRTSPFGNKEVRALASFSYADYGDRSRRNVVVNRLDSIRTKVPVATLGEADAGRFGDDAIDIVRDWVTVAEDGYLTLRLRMRHGSTAARHDISLVSGTNPGDPGEFVLRHNANGDVRGDMADALIAFNLNHALPTDAVEPHRITLRWKSAEGWKTTTFNLRLRRTATAN